MRNKTRRWLFVWVMVVSSLLHILEYHRVEANTVTNTTKNENSTNPKEQRSVFSPRMDYEHWTPLGRGDPLKNDPTYDYVPPVLERVHYWVEPAQRKPDAPLPDENQKTEILLLGVSSKKPSTQVQADSRRDTYDPYIKFVDGPKFSNTYQRNSRPHYQIPYSYYPSPFYKNKISYGKSEQRIPYTMLMPPPVQSIETYASTTQPTPTVQESNLVYQSSTLDADHHTADTSSLVTWRTPLPYNFKPKNQTDSLISKHHYLNNVSHLDNFNVNHDSFEMTLNSDDLQISGPDVMYKGQVSDADLDPSSTYVNIGKPETQVHSVSGTAAVAVEPPVLVTMKKPVTLQTLQTIQTMQTMQPPPIPTKSSPLVSLLQKEITPQMMMSSMLANIPRVTTAVYTTTPAPSTTTTSSLTTDPLFKHYKQPSEPLRGPMYLIIQGHSKVKTYGPAKQVHGINIQEINEIPNSDYKDEYQVKHLHTFRKKPEEMVRIGRARTLDNLVQVVQTGLGAIDYNRRHDSQQETEVEAGFDVAPGENVTSEVYRKGIVEEGELSRKF